MKTIRKSSFLAGLLALAISAALPANADWPLGGWGGRSLARIEIPGATCGDGTPYAIYASRAPNPVDKRFTVYFGGGGSTICATNENPCPTEDVVSSMRHLEGMVDRLSTASESRVVERVFMDHPDNDEFMGPGHWLLLPYCTQDMHTGRRSDLQTYDMTNPPDNGPPNQLREQVEALLDSGRTIASIEAEYPALEIAAVSGGPGAWQIDSLLLHVRHRGDLNVQAALQYVFAAQQSIDPTFPQNAKIVVTGGSAGGFGALMQFRRFADFLDDSPGTALTLVPMAGAPIERWYSEEAGGLVYSPALAAEIDKRWDFYAGQRACEIAGGDHQPGGADDCDDLHDLLDHYRLQRYPGRDIRYMMVANKEDYVGVEVLYGDDPATVTGLCQTIHSYFQDLAARDDVEPYAVWQFYAQGTGGPPQREHTPDRATMLMAIQDPWGSGEPSPYSQLRFMNALAARTLDTEIPHIEFAPVLVDDIDDPDSTFSLRTDIFTWPVCNIARHVKVGARKFELRDDTATPANLRKRKFRFKATSRGMGTASRITVPAPGTRGDPSSQGGRLIVRNTAGSNENVEIELPASGWSALGNPAAPRGWRWRAPSTAAVSSVVVKPDSLTIRAGGEDFAYSLDEATQDSVGVRLDLGDGWAFCSEAAARTAGNPPTSDRFDLPGRFSGEKRPPAPSLCVQSEVD